jgi:hypothetical protein
MYSIIILTLLALSIGIYKNAIRTNPLRFTCSHYLVNVYLYILFACVLIFGTVLFVKDNIYIYQYFLYIIILSFLLLFSILTTSPTRLIWKHIQFILFVMTLGCMIYPKVKTNILYETMVMTICLFGILTGIAHKFPKMISLSWRNPLLYSLIAIILVRIILIIKQIGLKENVKSYSIILSYITIVVFIFFTLYDAKRLQIKAKTCTQVDYIRDSLNPILNFTNILQNMLFLRSRK